MLGSACTMVRPPALQVSPQPMRREAQETQGRRGGKKPRSSPGAACGAATGGRGEGPGAFELSGTRATGLKSEKKKKAREGNPYILFKSKSKPRGGHGGLGNRVS